MEKSFGGIAEKIRQFTPKRCYLAFVSDGGNLLYSTLPRESEETLKKLTKISSVWDIGDYQLKKFEKSNMLVYKVSPRIVLALESYEKEGVLIVVAKRIEETYYDLFRDLENQLPASQAKEVNEAPPEEPSLELVQEDSLTEETVDSLTEETVDSLTEETVDSLTEETEKMVESTPQEESKLEEAKKRMKKMW